VLRFRHDEKGITTKLIVRGGLGSPTRVCVDLCTNEDHDAGASDLLTGLMEQHEKTAWMLRAMLESKIEGSMRLF
jgi:hypothetical protein